jgi:hypothetical protein
MTNLKIKIITGFRKDQYYTIDAEEAHKAYYLFLNPEKRGVFKNGVAIVGQSIQGIEPDFHATMGWNPTHVLDSEDWNEIKGRGIEDNLRITLSSARQLAQIGAEKSFTIPLSEAIKALPARKMAIETKAVADKFKI